MSSICSCCGQIVGSTPPSLDNLRKDLEIEQVAIDAVLYGEGFRVDGVRVDAEKVKRFKYGDTSVSENSDDSEEHF